MSPAIPQERPLIDRMREAVPGMEWRMSGNAVVGWDTGRDIVSANPRGHLLCWVKAKNEPHAVDIQYPGDNEAVRLVREWWEKTHPKPALDPIAERGERLKALLPMLAWKHFHAHWRGCRGEWQEVVVADTGWVHAWTKEQTREHNHALEGRSFTTDDELIALLTKWRDATYLQTEKADAMTPEYRKFIDKVNEFVEAKWSLKDGDLICEARGRVYTINHKDGKYTLRSTIDSALWVVVGVSTLDQAVASLRHRMFQPNTLSEAKRIEHEMREAAAKSIVVNATVFDPVTAQATVSGLMKEGERRIALPPTPVQSDTQRNDVIATFMAGTRAMQGILDVEGIDGDLLQIVGQMDQYHVLNLTDPRTRKKHVIAYDGQRYLDGEPIIFDELLNEVLAIVTLEEEQEEPMSTRRTRAELVVDGAYLGAAKTAADNARDAVAAALASGLPAEKQENARGVIADLLRTKAGSGAVAWLLGEAIRQLPDPGAKAEKFADSLMIVGAMQGTEQALDAVVEPLKALVSGVVESLPEPEKVRAVADESQEEAHEAPRRGKRAHA